MLSDLLYSSVSLRSVSTLLLFAPLQFDSSRDVLLTLVPRELCIFTIMMRADGRIADGAALLQDLCSVRTSRTSSAPAGGGTLHPHT
jgi:hypothetical protein